MGVYINGMEMPKNHNHVTITIWSNGAASYGLYNRGESLVDFRNVEVVPVPPHGRLIDADALHELFEYQWHHLQVLNWNGNPTAKARQSGINWCISTMRDSAPTIIPASKGGE